MQTENALSLFGFLSGCFFGFTSWYLLTGLKIQNIPIIFTYLPIQYLNYHILNNVACKLLWTFTHILGIIALQYFFGKKMWLSLKLRVTEKNEGYLVGNIFKHFFI